MVFNVFKYLAKKFNIFKSFAGKYIPTPVKTEYNTMKTGIDTIRNRFLDNYTQASRNARLSGSTKSYAFIEGLTSAIAQTRISRNEIPSLFAIAGGCSFPYPGTTEAGYVIGKVLTSKPVYNTGKRVISALPIFRKP